MGLEATWSEADQFRKGRSRPLIRQEFPMRAQPLHAGVGDNPGPRISGRAGRRDMARGILWLRGSTANRGPPRAASIRRRRDRGYAEEFTRRYAGKRTFGHGPGPGDRYRTCHAPVGMGRGSFGTSRTFLTASASTPAWIRQVILDVLRDDTKRGPAEWGGELCQAAAV